MSSNSINPINSTNSTIKDVYSMNIDRFFFTADGSYGYAGDEDFAVIYTGDFTPEQFDQIDEASDSMKLELAQTFRALNDAEKDFEPSADWIDVPFILDSLQALVKSMDQDYEIAQVTRMLASLREGLGLRFE